MIWLWVGVIAVALVVEMATSALVSVWFIAGGMLSLIACLLGASSTIQYIVFVVASAITLLACRPLIAKSRQKSAESKVDNVERYIGKDAIVEEKIDNILGTGKVIANGVHWAANSSDDDTIIVSGVVEIIEVNGARMKVKPKRAEVHTRMEEETKAEETKAEEAKAEEAKIETEE